MSSTAEKAPPIKETVAEWSAAGTKITGNVIPGVKILGFESPSHKRRYPVDAMRKSANKYENAQVNFDHPAGLYDPSKRNLPRPASTPFGRIRNPRVDESRGLIGDLHFNPGHPFAEAVKWAAENDPGQYALSHLADLVGSYESGWFVTSDIEKVHSVDVVSNGGTTAGLYESAAMQEGERKVELISMTRDQLQAARQDLKILTVAEALAQETRLKELETKVTAAEAENGKLKVEIDGHKAVTAKTTRDDARKVKIAEAKLPEHLNTPTFQAMCMESGTTDERFTALLAERKELADKTTGKVQKPTSSSKGVGESAGASKGPDTSTSKGFASAVKGS
jgi:hypothetical protein